MLEIKKKLFRIFLALALLVLQSCASFTIDERDGGPKDATDVTDIPDAVPVPVTRSKYGNPESYVVRGKRYHVVHSNSGFVQQGLASWYGTKFHGQATSSGEIYDMYAMTAAHKTLLLPAYVEVTNLENSRTAIVKVNDRGPFHENRIIDLSYAAAKKLGITEKGTAMVQIRIVEPESRRETVATNDAGVPAPYGGRGAPVATLTPVTSDSGSNTATGESFFIQLGAFNELKNAQQLLTKLQTIGSTLLKISQTAIGDRTLYRVRVGPLPDTSSVNDMLQRLRRLSHYEHYIVTH